jgi:hypothetical protein
MQQLTSISLSNGPFWEHGLQIFRCLLSQWRCSGEDAPYGREIVLLHHVTRFGERDDDGWYEIQATNLVGLYRFEEAFELEFRKYDYTIATIRSQMCDDYQSIYVVER